MSITLSYEKFVLKQRIRELEKAIRCIPQDENKDSLYSVRKVELDDLNKRLDGIIDEKK